MNKPEVDAGLPADPDNFGWVLGWGVYRESPWELVGVYSDREYAAVLARKRGLDYATKYGSHRLTSTDFIFQTDKLKH